jgi:Flp pilus assembly protein TadG
MRAVKARREPTAVLRDDAGVIAIIVALSVSTFVLAFAALAVDLGMAYERQSSLQAVADRLALAGAQGLPSITDAQTHIQDALHQLCAQNDDTRGTPGICPAPRNWMRDGNPANGQVTFYQDTGQTSLFAAAGGSATPTPVTSGQATGIKIVLPPSKVKFGFAGAFTNGSANVVKSATARIGTPLGAGILPFSLTQSDLDSGRWCVTTGVRGSPTDLPVVPDGAPALMAVPDTIAPNTTDQSIRFTIVGITRINARSIAFHSQNADGPLSINGPGTEEFGSTSYTVTMPSDSPGAHTQVWATFSTGIRRHRTSYTTQLADVTYSGVAPAGSDPCAGNSRSSVSALAQRGYSKLARSSDNPDSDELASNIRTGPQVREYPTGGLVDTLGTLVDCVSVVFSPATTCLSNQSIATQQQAQAFAQDLTSGLFSSAGNAPGRLEQACPGDDLDSIQGQSGARIDKQAALLSGTPESAATSLLAPGVSPSDLFNAIQSGQPVGSGQRGWITSRVLRCGRFAVMPVINPISVQGIVQGQQIVSFTYVWIDDLTSTGTPVGNQGVTFSNGQVSSLQGYVINPGFLPSEVAGSLTVGPYLGADMPKEALLVHDLGAPDA